MVEISFLDENNCKKCKALVENDECGVPQGCILGPLLLLIFVSDLLQNLRPFILILFADNNYITTLENSALAIYKKILSG